MQQKLSWNGVLRVSRKMGSQGQGLVLGCCLLLAFTCGLVLSHVPRDQREQQEQEEAQELLPPLDHDKRNEEKHEKYSPSQGGEPPASRCFRCCDPGTPVYQAIPAPQINITILKGEKGDRGDRGLQGKYGKTGSVGARGHMGPKGQKGSVGAPGDRCKNHYAAFSVGRKKPLHSSDYYQTVVFDTEFVNLYGHFNMFTGRFYCYVPGIYFFSLNVHTWNQKETYLHIMRNAEEVVILYAQVSDRSIMQSQSLMLQLQEQDEVWVRLFKGERENAIFSDEFDTYITFSGYLVKHASEP
ncbi:complement C1q tumor necrosis factor-related protein 1 isoform X2 [Marmota monax]|uniref:complement C1q tumor necrosis factor-related protein 1 isoform X2 n=1 Tax=Marmota monax TaxID=9995 RepID=UPI001EB08864|nr:complement C1q tumor necrosis factor-related protein 1 isoform X2 [Marmota monax]XP_046302624.1 complement C1q tumor necrosis factor-related protein 1 isoform X2 [Marmota monax]XP_058435959.1 complement C1q tumor necrosis factor-related protein 1 isoform X2 [Marmota monax]XP_058435960.1 complement C1q tumor necrosis factor-related protein 1 isoform X2 [Marmota monax]